MKIKKLLAGALSATMLLGTMSVTAFAASNKLPTAQNGKITLTEDVTLSAQTVITDSIDLNQHTLTLAGTNLNEIGGNVTISNGTIKIPDGEKFGDAALAAGGYSHNGSNVTLKDLTIYAEDYTAGGGLIGVYGNSKLTVENVAIYANDAAGKGAEAGIFWGNEQTQSIKIKNVDVYADAENIVMGGIKDADVDDLTFTGKVSKYVFSVVGGTVKNSDFALQNTVDENIDAVWRDYETYHIRTLNLINTKVTGIPECKAGNAFDFQNEGSSVIADPATKFEDVNENTITTNAAKAVARVGDKLYTTVEDAAKNAGANDTITLVDNAQMTKQLALKSNLDLGKKELKLATLTQISSAIEINGDVTVSNGTITVPGGFYAGDAIIMLNREKKGDDVVFEDLTINASNYSAGCGLIGITGGTTLTVKGGKVAITGMNAIRDNSGICDTVFGGNHGVGYGKLVIDGTRIETADTYQLFYFVEAQIKNVSFEGVNKEFLFSHLFGTIENSSFTYTNEGEKIRAVARFYDNEEFTAINTKFIDIPELGRSKTSENKQIMTYGNSKFYADDLTAAYLDTTAGCNVNPAKGFYYDSETETIRMSKATVESKASAPGAEISLDNLGNNAAIDHTVDATYKVVVAPIKSDDKEALSGIVAENQGKSIVAYDISVVKTEGDVETEVAVENQKVTITLPTAIPTESRSSVKLYHIVEGERVEIEDFTISSDGKQITFTAPSFSGYVVAYDTPAVDEEDITTKVIVDFEQINEDNQNEYSIVLKAEEGKVLNRLTSADLTFELTQGTGNVSYQIESAANISLIPGTNGKYTFHFDGINMPSVTADKVTIGKVVFDGFCENAKFGVKDVEGNRVNLTKANSVNYTVEDDNLDITSEINPLTLVQPTCELTVEITFPNKVYDNSAAYQNMRVSIVTLGSKETIALGSDMTEDGKYVITKDLVKGTTYTITVEGAGYRTVNYSTRMDNDKKLVFWNNVMDNPTIVEYDRMGNPLEESAQITNFLAGELVKDGVINIYDLSAVVSYFGESPEDTDSAWTYAKYDLNRDGIIDSKDVSFVLDSWGK